MEKVKNGTIERAFGAALYFDPEVIKEFRKVKIENPDVHHADFLFRIGEERYEVTLEELVEFLKGQGRGNA